MSGRRGSTMAVIQARMSSSRLPGKVLLPMAGEPMIVRQLERTARASTLDRIVVATSSDPGDDQLADALTSAGIEVIRGPLEDVLARYQQAIATYRPDVVVRMTADCPLISPTIIDHVVQAFHASDADYVSNTMQPTYPDGQDVEVVAADALQEAAETFSDPDEREHVTLGIYRQPEHFAIENVIDQTGCDNSHLRWTVDTPEDYHFAEAVYTNLYASNPAFEYDDILAFLADRPEITRTEADAARNAALDGLDTGVMHHRDQGSTP